MNLLQKLIISIATASVMLVLGCSETDPPAPTSDGPEIQSNPKQNQPVHTDAPSTTISQPATTNTPVPTTVGNDTDEPTRPSVHSQPDLTPVLAEGEGLFLGGVVIARGVNKRHPIDPGNQFSIADGTKIYAVLDVRNPDQTENQVTVSWKRPGTEKEIGKVTVSVGPHKKWRTWAYTNHAKRPGRWTAIIRNGENDIIGQIPFIMTE